MPIRRPVVHLIAAARPNSMRMAPMCHQLTGEVWCGVSIVHNRRHYHTRMPESSFRDLRVPPPDVHLGEGSGTYAATCLRRVADYSLATDSTRIPSLHADLPKPLRSEVL